jgi:hypothetical protein
MTVMSKRFTLLFAGLAPSLATFWFLLWSWESYKGDFESDIYWVGWIITTLLLIGVPCAIFFITTINCVVEDRDHKVDQHYENLTCGLRRGRAMLSQRLAPPVEEEEEA